MEKEKGGGGGVLRGGERGESPAAGLQCVPALLEPILVHLVLQTDVAEELVAPPEVADDSELQVPVSVHVGEEELLEQRGQRVCQKGQRACVGRVRACVGRAGAPWSSKV